MINRKYLQDILDKSHLLSYPDINTAEALVIRARTAIKTLFPIEVMPDMEIGHVSFKVTWYPNSEAQKLDQFTNAKLKFITLLETRIDQVDHRNAINLRIAENKKLEANANSESQSTTGTLIQRRKEYEKLLHDRNVQIEGLKAELKKDRSNQLIKDWGFWGLIVVIISGAFWLGHFFGTNKFDAEKSNMRDTISTLQTKLNSLTAHSKPDSVENLPVLKPANKK